MSGIDSDLIRGHIDTIILKTLFDGDKYGYEILDEVSRRSGGSYELKQPTLYSCLKRLENQGLISSYWVDSEIGGKRHYYCLTEQGKETYISNQKDWLRSRQIIDNLIWEDAPALTEREIITERPENSDNIEVDDTTPSLSTEVQEESVQTNDEELTKVENDINEEALVNTSEENIETKDAIGNQIETEEKAEKVEEIETVEKFSWDDNTQYISQPVETKEVESFTEEPLIEATNDENSETDESEEAKEYFNWDTNEENNVIQENVNEETINENTPELEQENLPIDETEQDIEETEQDIEEDEVTDIMQLLGHYDLSQNSSVDEKIEELSKANEDLNSTQEENTTNEFLENFAKNYLHISEIEPETLPEKQEETDYEVTDDFNLNINEYLDGNNSFFVSNETKDKIDFISPSVVTDGYENNTPNAIFEENETPDNEEDEIYTSSVEFIDDDFETSNDNEDKKVDDDLTPTYYSFGEEITRQPLQEEYQEDIDFSLVQDNELDNSINEELDDIYINPENQDNPSFYDTKTEEETSFEQDTPVYDEVINNNREEFKKETSNFYSKTSTYETIKPNYTDEIYKKKLNELTTYAKQSSVIEEETTIVDNEIFFDATAFLEKNKHVKDYTKLISDFESEGLQVRVHHKLVKESKETKTYIQTNKIKMTRNWISYCFIVALLAVTFAVMSQDTTTYYDFSYKYFIIGALIAMIVPIITTIIYAINPYKKNVAQYSAGVSFLLSGLIFVQLLMIIYCVNLQLGFYSFTQEYYNHLFWIIPMIISIYPLLNTVIYTSLYRSKNFHS